jgi:autotransporter passenger strand-loop-strand repeat protein
VASATTVLSGGFVGVYPGGTVDSSTVDSGGKIQIGSGSLASDTSVLSGGTLQLMGGALLSGTTTFAAGATEQIGSGYVLSDAVVGSGIMVNVQSSGTVTDLAIASAGSAVISSGAVVSGANLNGGFLEIASGGITRTSEFDFTSAGGTLQLDDSQHFAGVVSGFGVPGGIDLRDIAFGSGTTLGYSGNTSSGALTVSDGMHSATINLLGQYAAGNFTLQSDGNGGTLVTDPPLAGLAGSPFLTPPHS